MGYRSRRLRTRNSLLYLSSRLWEGRPKEGKETEGRNERRGLTERGRGKKKRHETRTRTPPRRDEATTRRWGPLTSQPKGHRAAADGNGRQEGRADASGRGAGVRPVPACSAFAFRLSADGPTYRPTAPRDLDDGDDMRQAVGEKERETCPLSLSLYLSHALSLSL